MINALTIDLEYWYNPELVKDYYQIRHPGNMNDEDQIVEAVTPLLNLLDEFEIKATFFVLGVVAEEHPELIKMIYEKGHEIGSHAYSHKTLYELGKEGFEEEIKRCTQLLWKITKEKPIGFRAPSFSIDNSTRWAFEILENYGFKYDSSIFPIKTKLYGVYDAPLQVYTPSNEDITKEDSESGITEFPLTVIKKWRNIPISGGFYLRAMPFWLLKFLMRKVNKTRPTVIYVHPWETYAKTPRLNLPLRSRVITYYGIDSALKKFEGLLRSFKFAPMKEVLGL
jgi:polysaccharide deacetylase family protein (PEP-CTERM system associated)